MVDTLYPQMRHKGSVPSRTMATPKTLVIQMTGTDWRFLSELSKLLGMSVQDTTKFCWRYVTLLERDTQTAALVHEARARGATRG